jgi:hypothetical protein
MDDKAKIPVLSRGAYTREAERLVKLYRDAEDRIIKQLSRARRLGLVDYHLDASLQRVREILRELLQESYIEIPGVIEAQYYLGKTGAAAYRNIEGLSAEELAAKHARGYANAMELTIGEQSVVQSLVQNLEGTLTEAVLRAEQSIEGAAAAAQRAERLNTIGRLTADPFRSSGLNATATTQITGEGSRSAAKIMREELAANGVKAFTDVKGRNWTLSGYTEMAVRTTARQATNLGVLNKYPDHDLYKMSERGTTCALCAPYEGRVYSRSGTSEIYPPLADAFGKKPGAVGNALEDTYLTIHPRCLHVLTPFSEEIWEDEPEKLEEIRKFSNPKTNPYDVDPRTEAQRKAYNTKQQARTRMLNSMKQYNRYKAAKVKGLPASFQSFAKYKKAGSPKYNDWVKSYRKINQELRTKSSDES